MRSVVLVCGPPCAGKSTFVDQRRAPGDVVVDFDQIALELGSADPFDHDEDVSHRARAVQIERESAVADMRSGRAWVVRTAADPVDREFIASNIGATEIVVCDPGLDVCLERAVHRPAWTAGLIRSWYAAQSGAALRPRGRHPGLR